MAVKTKGIVKISRRKAVELLYDMYGTNQIFRCRTIRRHAKEMPDGTVSTERDFVCRLDVDCFKKGGPPAYDPTEKDLLWICDLLVARRIRHYEKNGIEIPKHLARELRSPYRSINLLGILSLTIGGVEYQVTTL
jgi:hypothetical protein